MANDFFIGNISDILGLKRILPENRSHSLEESLKAKTKDPLWFLSRQWQLGEFRAKDGGYPVKANIQYEESELLEIKKSSLKDYEDIIREIPLEYQVEEEELKKPDNVNKPDTWDDKSIEYSFNVRTKNHELSVDSYDGERLEWYDFNLNVTDSVNGVGNNSLDKGNDAESLEVLEITPAKLSFKGMPSSRWWRYEDGKVDLGSITRPNLNYFAMLLAEFGLIYSKNWYALPIGQKCGSIRSVKGLNVVDSFGIVKEIKPVSDKTQDGREWSLFTLYDNVKNASQASDLFYLHDVLSAYLESGAFEEITFARDEIANLVWAVESKYWNEDTSTIINRDDEERAKPDDLNEAEKGLYRLMSELPQNWIPFVPRQISADGSIVLRRGRTVHDPSIIQYKGQILNESKYIHEHKIPAVPLTVTRRFKLAVLGKEICKLKEGKDGWEIETVSTKKPKAWIGRNKRIGTRPPESGLKFDCQKDD